VTVECRISEYVDHVTLEEADDRVTIGVWTVQRGTKLALTRRRADVELRAPLGSRPVFDGATGGRRRPRGIRG
jgi:hypothetical protein